MQVICYVTMTYTLFVCSVDRKCLGSHMTIESQDTNAVTTPDILTVAQLNQAVNHLLEDSFAVCWVRGEISNFTNASSGHWYFTLKDEAASVRAVMFRGRAVATGFTPKVGDSVELKARVTLYEARGEYQLQVEQLRRAGLGTLFEAFVALKNKLAAEGLFASEAKRALAPYPKAIGIITSLGAAALHDVLTALARRAPHVPVIIYPALVQGAGAALQLRQARAHLRLSAALPDLSPVRLRLLRAATELQAGQSRLLLRQQGRLESASAQLRALSPEHTLARGYAIVRTTEGQILRDALNAQFGQTLELTLAQGALTVKVN